MLERHILGPLGVEVAPYYLTDGYGVSFVLGGLNMTTRDYARFGQMIAQGGMWQGRQIVPRDWVEASTIPSAPGGAGYGYQWWIADGAGPGEVNAQGIGSPAIIVVGDVLHGLQNLTAKALAALAA